MQACVVRTCNIAGAPPSSQQTNQDNACQHVENNERNPHSTDMPHVHAHTADAEHGPSAAADEFVIHGGMDCDMVFDEDSVPRLPSLQQASTPVHAPADLSEDDMGLQQRGAADEAQHAQPPQQEVGPQSLQLCTDESRQQQSTVAPAALRQPAFAKRAKGAPSCAALQHDLGQAGQHLNADDAIDDVYGVHDEGENAQMHLDSNDAALDEHKSDAPPRLPCFNRQQGPTKQAARPSATSQRPMLSFTKLSRPQAEGDAASDGEAVCLLSSFHVLQTSQTSA